MRTRAIFLAACLVLSGFVDCDVVLGQEDGRRYTMVLRGAPMHQVLEELARISEIDLIYSSDLVADRMVYCDGRELTSEALLRCILSDSGLDYVRSSTGTFVLIPSLQESPLHGDLIGRIVDSRTGEPLPDANVLLADASTGTTTNDAGLFNFSSVITGRHRILVTYVGYQSAVDSIDVDAGGPNTIQIELVPTTLSMEPILIDGLTQRLPSHELGAAALTGDDRTARGNLGTPDVARAAAGVPGVSMRHPLADLHIQGGDAGEHLTLLDGVPVRDPVTLGRHLGAFSPLAIQRITIHKAGFGASQGSHLSGVVALDHDVSASADAAAAFDFDPISFTGKVQGRLPVINGQRADGMLSLRSSIWDVFRDPGLESLLDRWNAVDPILAGIWIREPVSTHSLAARRHRPNLAFSDLHGAARVELGSFHTLQGSAYRATNRISSELAVVNADSTTASDRLILTRDEYDWTNWTGQIRHTWLVSARSVATVQILAANHASRYRYLSAHDEVPEATDADSLAAHAAELRPVLERAVGSNEENQIREVSARATLSRSLSPNRHVDLSLSATHIDSRFELGNQFVAPFSHAANAWELAGYVAGRLALGLQTTIEPGLRLTYLPDRRTLYGEPRLAIRYDRSSSRIGPYAVRLAGGLYRQYIPSFSLTSSGSTSVVPFVRFWLPVDQSLAPPNAYHLAAEGLLMPHERWTVTLESYHKWQSRLLTLDYAALVRNHPSVRPRPEPAPLGQAEFVSPATGRSFGGSLGLQYTDARVSASMQYAYSHSMRGYPDRFGEQRQPVPWNEPHRVSTSARLALTSSLSIHADAEAAWGRRWALRRSYFDYLAVRAEPQSYPPHTLDDPGASTLPTYYGIDLGLTYDLTWDPVRFQFRAAVVNVLDRHNVYDRSLEPAAAGFETVDRALPGRRPVVSLRLIY